MRTYRQRFEGIIPNLERRYRETASELVKQEIEQYMVQEPCPVCGGKRLKPEVLAVTVGEKNIALLSEMSVEDAYAFMGGLKLSRKEELIGSDFLLMWGFPILRFPAAPAPFPAARRSVYGLQRR